MRLLYIGFAVLLGCLIHLPSEVYAESSTHTVRSGENLREIARQHGVSVQALINVNRLPHPNRLSIGQRLVVPGGPFQPPAPKISIPAPPQELAQELEGFPGFLWPVQGRISSGYGRRKHPILKRVQFHQGIDIAAPTGTPIVAARDGRVTFSGWKKQAGRVVILEHDDGFASVYAHTSENLVEVGDAVRAGEEIARVGRSGLTTGPHLYLEIRRDGQHLNPLMVLTDDLTRVAKRPLPSQEGEPAPASFTNGTLAFVETPEPLPLAESLRPINTWR